MKRSLQLDRRTSVPKRGQAFQTLDPTGQQKPARMLGFFAHAHPPSFMRGTYSTILASTLDALVGADARPHTPLTLAPATVMLAKARSAALLALLFSSSLWRIIDPMHPLHLDQTSAPTSAARQTAENLGDRRYASMTAKGARARSAWGRSSDPTSVDRACARNAEDRAYASILTSITAEGAPAMSV